jgi:hypothetical protein
MAPNSPGGAVAYNPGEESSGSSINEGDGRRSAPDEDPELANFIQEERLGRLKYKCKRCKFHKAVDKGTTHSDVVRSISHCCKPQQELVTELKRQGLLEYPKEGTERDFQKLMGLCQTESLMEHSSRDVCVQHQTEGSTKEATRTTNVQQLWPTTKGT